MPAIETGEAVAHAGGGEALGVRRLDLWRRLGRAFPAVTLCILCHAG
jgi:hypothetical protein